MSKKKPKPTIKELVQEINALTDALQRERADAQNIRRRHEQQLSSVRDMVKIDVVKQLLPVIDNFERALTHVPKKLKDDDYVKGVQGVANQFDKTLKEIGVVKIDTVGESFDPHLHEAVSTEGDGGDEIVSEELQAGYMLDDQVIRHAMVKVKT